MSEYIRDLIRHEQERKAMKKLEGLILEGIQSGEAVEWTPADLKKVRDEVRRRGGEEEGLMQTDIIVQ